MWRQNTFPGDPDSDQSISDEEDFNVDLRDNCVPINESKEKEEALQIQSRLDTLRGSYESRTSISSSPKRQTSISLEDEVEMVDFTGKGGFIFSPRKVSTCNLEEEAISDDEENIGLKFSVKPGVKTPHKDGVHNVGNEEQYVANSWFAACKEAEALIRTNKNSFHSPSNFAYPKASKSCKGIKSKPKTKFSFRCQSHKEGLSSPFVYKDEHGVSSKFQEISERLETIDCGEHLIAELLEDSHGEKPKQSETVADEVEDFHQCNEHSVAELLDGLQDTTTLLRRSSTMYRKSRGKRVKVVLKRGTSLLEGKTIDCEDLPEPGGSSSSSDDQANVQNQKIVVPELKKQSIADRFQEAWGANSSDQAALVVPKPSGFGLFGKLQQVMQSEKFTETDFLNLQTRDSPNSEPSCIDVKILSRYFEAKLIVCRVCSGQDIEGFHQPENIQMKLNGRERTIIFNPRVCFDVDLEVGNSIRVHPPWREVRVRENDESIILSTYFSQISM